MEGQPDARGGLFNAGTVFRRVLQQNGRPFGPMQNPCSGAKREILRRAQRGANHKLIRAILKASPSMLSF